MANTAQSRKRARQADKNRAHNITLRSRMRTTIKKVRTQIEKRDKDAATAAFKHAVVTMDGMVNKGLAHRNTIARYKSRLVKQLKQLAAGA